MDLPAPGEAARRCVGEEGEHAGQRLGPAEQPYRPAPGWPASRRGERRRAAYRAFGHVALDWRGGEQRRLADPAGDLVDKRRDVGHRRLAGQVTRHRGSTQRIGPRRGEAHRLYPVTRIDPLDAQVEEAGEMHDIAGRARGADREPLLAAVDPVEQQHQCAHTAPARLQQQHHVGEQVGDHLLNRLGGADRLEQPALCDRRLLGHDRHDRFGDTPQCLVEAADTRHA